MREGKNPGTRVRISSAVEKWVCGVTNVGSTLYLFTKTALLEEER